MSNANTKPKSKPGPVGRVVPGAPDPAANPVAAPSVSFQPTVTPLGGGHFVIEAGKPVPAVEEVGTTKAARILGYASRSSIHEHVLNSPHAHLLRWRFTPGGGKILFEVPSLLAYKEATREDGK